jgi:predicted RNA-binding protein Jag
MIVNFFLKEDTEIEQSVSITVMRVNKRGRNQVMNAIDLDKMPDADRKIIHSAIALLEKYSQEEKGAVQIRYNL